MQHSYCSKQQACAHCPDCPAPADCRCLLLSAAGNHCLYNHSRAELNRRLGISAFQPAAQAAASNAATSSAPAAAAAAAEGGQAEQPPQHSYYTFQPAPGWRFIMLDGYDVSILGWPPGGWIHWECRWIRGSVHRPWANGWGGVCCQLPRAATCIRQRQLNCTQVCSCLRGVHTPPDLCCPRCSGAGHPLHEQARQLLEERNPNEEKNSNNGLVGLERRWAALRSCGAAGADGLPPAASCVLHLRLPACGWLSGGSACAAGLSNAVR